MENALSIGDIVGHVTNIVGNTSSGVIKWLTQFASAITANPIIEFFVIMSAVGLGVGLLRRLISVN